MHGAATSNIHHWINHKQGTKDQIWYVVNSKEYVTVSGAEQYCFCPWLLIDRAVAFHFPNNIMKKPLSQIMQFQQFIWPIKQSYNIKLPHTIVQLGSHLTRK